MQTVNTNLRKSRRQSSGKSAALGRFPRCVGGDDLRDSYDANPIYHRAKIWQIGFFTLNNTAVNIYYMMMLYIAYFASGVLGLGVALVSGLIAVMAVAEGIADPVIGWFIDRTRGRFGKFRPFMVAGNGIMALSLLLMYISQGAGNWRLPMFIFAYGVFILGYSCQFCVTRAAQSVLTNDPKQRPIISAFDLALNVILYVGVTFAVSNLLVPKHGGFTTLMFRQFFVFTALAAAICTTLAVIGIWEKDRIQYFGLAEKSPKIKLRSCIEILRENRNIQMLMISSGTDKLFSNITQNAVVTIMIYGIIAGDFALSGQMNMFVFMPSMLVAFLCIQFARKKGQKEALLVGTYGGIVFTALIFLLFLFGDPTTLSFTNWSMFTVLFMVFLALRGGFMSINNSIIVPMVADCIDYEVSRSRRYAPGMIGALFSCVDKLVTSLNTVVIGGLLLIVGFYEGFPTVDTPYSRSIFWVAIICFCGLPILGWIINIICLRHYSLDKGSMDQVQHKIGDIKRDI